MIRWILFFVLNFFLFEFFGYVIHKVLHNKRFPRLMKPHMTHHLKLYPAEDFLSEKYRSPGKDTAVFLFAPFVVGLIGIVFIVFPAPYDYAFAGQLLFHSWLTNYLHDSIHIKGHFLERFRWFIWMRHLHYQHHIHMRRNLGIMTFGVDKVLDTYTIKAKPNP